MKTILMTGAATIALTLAAPAYAQDATTAGVAAETEAPVDTDEASPGDIVVTAQKRSERLQDVPLAISVVSGDALTAKGVVNIEGAQYLVPTLNFRKSGTAINQSLFLRGVGTSTFSIVLPKVCPSRLLRPNRRSPFCARRQRPLRCDDHQRQSVGIARATNCASVRRRSRPVSSFARAWDRRMISREAVSYSCPVPKYGSNG